MARKPVPCSECGKACQPSGSRYRAGVAPVVTCLECRRNRPGYHGKFAAKAELRIIACEICGQAAPARTNRDSGSQRQKTCGSDECRREVERRKYKRYRDSGFRAGRNRHLIWHVNCAECGRLFIAQYPETKTCAGECRRKYNSRVASKAIMRRYRADPEFRDLVISKAHNRHARRLGLGTITTPAALVDYLMKRDHGRCGICRKPIRAKVGPRRPSIDHIVPLSCGGEHALENLQPAHYVCNLSKGNRGGGEQVLLVG